MAATSARAAKLELALAALQDLDREGLRSRWQALTGRAPPATFRSPLLRAAVAYELQERVHGGLRLSTRRLLRRMAQAAGPVGRDPSAGVAAKMHLAAEGAGQGRGSGDGGPDALSEFNGNAAVRSMRECPGQRVSQPPLRIKPGTCLLRTWQGQTHEVLVGDAGMSYRGKFYRSLSEVARRITGQRWSGPRFFGLTRRTPPRAE